MTRFGALLVAVLLLTSPFTYSEDTRPATNEAQTITLTTGNRLIHAEVADTEAKRQQGLMYRKTLPENSGMLFVFHKPVRSCMWMKNTLLPLSVAFIDRDGVVTNIEEMKPFTTDSHCSDGWIRYALEMNAGWFDRKGVKPGSRIKGLPR